MFPVEYSRTRRFTVGAARNVSIIDAGRRLLFLRSRSPDEPTLCLWVADVGQDGVGQQAGEEQILVDPAQLGGPDDSALPAAERARRERARETGSGIVSYSLDQALTKACFALAGSLFLVDLASGEVTTPPNAGGVFDPRLSPDGHKIAYASGNDLRMVDLSSLTDQPVMQSGNDAISYGRADFIAAEEMGRSRGFWWSPDASMLLVTRVDENPVEQWWIGDPAHPERQPNAVRYPAAGTINAVVDLYLVKLDDLSTNQGPTKIHWDDASTYEYLANVIWPSGKQPHLIRQTRDQREVSIAELHLDNEAAPSLVNRHRIYDDVWVELIASSPTVCDAGLLTIEDIPGRDRPGIGPGPGRRALVLDGTPVTGDELRVRSIEAVVDDLAIVAAWTVPSEIHLFAVPLGSSDALRGVRPPVRLTDQPGVHGIADWMRPPSEASSKPSASTAPPDTSTTSSPAEALFVVSSSRPDLDHTALNLHRLVDLIGETHLGPSVAEIKDTSQRPSLQAFPLFHPLGADRLESAIFFPADHDGETPLPVLLDPYGGPHAQRVLKTYRPHLVSQWFADHGFVVIVTDGRGTPGRGPRWERQVWGDLAEPVLEDQLAALDAAASEFDLLDLSRVGIRGWSFGGYLAALAVLRRPDRFHAAIAGAPVTDWRLYDTHYTERYLGHPDSHPLHYQRTDLMADAANLKRPLMLIHGLADDNVVAAHTLRFSTALLAAGRPHRVLPLSGVTHMTPQETVAENLLRIQLSFLQEMLYGQPMMASSEEPAAPVVTSEPAGQLMGYQTERPATGDASP